MIGGPRDLATTQQCISGLCDILESQGLDIQKHLMLPGPLTLVFGREMTKQLVRSEQNFTAVFCYNDIVDVGVCPGLRDCGKKVSEDVSVVGVDNLPVSEAAYHALTTVEIYPWPICQRSAQVLTNTLKGKKSGHKEKIILPPQLIIRA
jgi:LacI family transcriptional regulator